MAEDSNTEEKSENVTPNIYGANVVIGGSVSVGGDFAGRDIIHGFTPEQVKSLLESSLASAIEKIMKNSSPSEEYRNHLPLEVDQFTKLRNRESELFDLLNNVEIEEIRTISIIGTCGSGKSSLARAGLIASLFNYHIHPDNYQYWPNGGDWFCKTILPTERPLETLIRSIWSQPIAGENIDYLVESMRNDYTFLSQQLIYFLSYAKPRPKYILLLVEQFDDIFLSNVDPFEREAFIGSLLHATIKIPDLRLVITLRAEKYACCAPYPSLRTELSICQNFIGHYTDFNPHL